MRKRLWNSFKIAFSMYSKIPMPGAEWTVENMSYAMCFFPWIGVVIGGLTWGAFRLKEAAERHGFSFSDVFFVVLLAVIPLMVTGGIHLDGFLDTKDALSSCQPKEKRLEILKDPHTGSFAIISGIIYMLLYVGIYSSLTPNSVRVIGMSFVLSRSLSGLSVVCFPQAKKKGLAATFSENAAKRNTRIVLGVYVVLISAGMLTVGRIVGAAAIVAAGAVFLHYDHMSKKQFGGITGDLAGYFLQMCEIVVAAVAVVADLLASHI